MGLAIHKGEVDAVANAEPIGSLLIAEGKVRNVADQIMDAPYKDEYCCEVIANGKWVDANPDTAARATRALLKGAKWVETNPRAAAIMAVEKKYLASTPELNTVALARLRYIPSVQLAEESVQTAGREMKVAKMLSPETDTEALAKRAFMHLPGVTDEWIKTLEVGKNCRRPGFTRRRYPVNRGLNSKGQRRFVLPKKNVRSTRPGGAESRRPRRGVCR